MTDMRRFGAIGALLLVLPLAGCQTPYGHNHLGTQSAKAAHDYRKGEHYYFKSLEHGPWVSGKSCLQKAIGCMAAAVAEDQRGPADLSCCCRVRGVQRAREFLERPRGAIHRWDEGNHVVRTSCSQPPPEGPQSYCPTPVGPLAADEISTRERLLRDSGVLQRPQQSTRSSAMIGGALTLPGRGYPFAQITSVKCTIPAQLLPTFSSFKVRGPWPPRLSAANEPGQ